MPGDRRLDRHAGVHQRERRAADRAHRRRAVRLERLGDDPDRVREVGGRPGCTASSARWASAPWPMSRRRGPRHAARLPDRVRREVVVVHEAAVLLEREVVDPLALLGGAEGEQRHDLRLAAGEEARAVRARADGHLAADRADLLLGAAVGAALVDRDLLADEVLVDRLGGLLDVVLRQRVLDDRVAGGVGADRERQLDAVDDPLVEQVLLRRLELLRVLLGLGQRAQVVLELLADRALDDRASASSRAPGRATCRTWSSRTMSFSVDSIESRPASRSRISPVIAAPSCRPCWRRCVDDLLAVAVVDLLGHVGVEPLRLAGLVRGAAPAPRRASRSPAGRGRAPRAARPRGPGPRRPRPSSGRPSCRRRSGRARRSPPSRAASG